ncbi:MAG: hypothetical protein IPH28_19865 [Cytophagaceae bacterium]|nr:hypothetical protein [Cytophagaceae bacterium]
MRSRGFPKSEKTNTDSLGSATFHSLCPRYYVMVTKEGYKLFVSDNFLHTNQKKLPNDSLSTGWIS